MTTEVPKPVTKTGTAGCQPGVSSASFTNITLTAQVALKDYFDSPMYVSK